MRFLQIHARISCSTNFLLTFVNWTLLLTVYSHSHSHEALHVFQFSEFANRAMFSLFSFAAIRRPPVCIKNTNSSVQQEFEKEASLNNCFVRRPDFVPLFSDYVGWDRSSALVWKAVRESKIILSELLVIWMTLLCDHFWKRCQEGGGTVEGYFWSFFYCSYINGYSVFRPISRFWKRD